MSNWWSIDNDLIVKATVSHPARGNWVACVQTMADAAPSGAVLLNMPGLTLRGTVRQAGVIGGRCVAEIVGGAGKLAARITGQHFRQGATGRIIAEMILSGAGEALDVASSARGLSSVLPGWTYFGVPAAVALDALCSALGCIWWVTDTGLVRLDDSDPASWPQSSVTDATTIDTRAEMNMSMVAINSSPILPRTVYDSHPVAAVDHEVNDARWRARVRWST